MKYLNKLSGEKLLQFLNDNDLCVLDNIEQCINESASNDGDSYYIKCYSFKRSNEKLSGAFRTYLKSKMPNLNFKIEKYFDCPIDIYQLTDFMIHRFYSEDDYSESDIELQKNYHKMMVDGFGAEGYLDDYNKYLDESLEFVENCNSRE